MHAKAHMMKNETASILDKLWHTGVDAVKGFACVEETLARINPPEPDRIIAVGKAAGDMALGARAHFAADIPTTVVTKYDHSSDQLKKLAQCEIVEAAHPVPDQNSLKGGTLVLKRVREMGPDTSLLLLVSGGASALVEVLQPGITLADLTTRNQEFMAQGMAIGEINTARKQMSLIKGGQLLDNFSGKQVHVVAISDVEGDGIDVIASGIGAWNRQGDHVRTIIAASNTIAREAVEAQAKTEGISVIANEENLYGDAETIARALAQKVTSGGKGLYIFGGEPTVKLPPNPGRGGRNQHLALLLANHIVGREDLTILIAGTDGTDGPTAEAGAIVDGNTVRHGSDVNPILEAADAGSYLAEQNALLTTGPTGTNVMDLVLAWKT